MLHDNSTTEITRLRISLNAREALVSHPRHETHKQTVVRQVHLKVKNAFVFLNFLQKEANSSHLKGLVTNHAYSVNAAIKVNTCYRSLSS